MKTIKTTISRDSLIQQATQLVSNLFPDLTITSSSQLHNGITNSLVLVSSSTIEILVRVDGINTHLIIDRTLELDNMVFLNSNGIAARVFAKFDNGIVYEYTTGEQLSPIDMSDSIISSKIALEMAKLHKTASFEESKLSSTLKSWKNLVPKNYTDPLKQLKFNEIDVDYIFNEINNLEKVHINSPIVFCHNDLLSGNIIKNSDKITFIDFEYGGANYQSFDIANHFCEFAGLDCDYNLYPDHSFQMVWLKEYLLEYTKEKVTDEMVNELCKQVDQVKHLPHLFWAAWALVEAEYSSIDFDYLDFAIKRMNEYRKLVPRS